MNILFISSIQMWGGGEVFLMDIMHGLQSRKHTVHLLCRPDTELAERATKHGFAVHTLRIGGDFDPLVIWNTSRIMKRLHIDVICTNMDKDLRFGGLAAKIAGVPAIIPSREIDYPLKDSLRYRFFYNKISDHIIVNSEATKETVLRSAPWLQKNKLTTVYKGIDLAPFDAPIASNIHTELGIRHDTALVTFVGQLDQRKGIQYLLDAWRNISNAEKKAVLLLVGKGPMEQYIREFREKHSLQDTVVLLGFREDIPALLRQSTMLTLPSLWEGFGYVLVEAMAARIPTVATQASSIPEIVEDGKTGILVPPRSHEPLAEAILKLLRDEDIRTIMGSEGRKKVERMFTIDTMVNSFENIFKQTVELKRQIN